MPNPAWRLVDLEEVDYGWIPGLLVGTELLAECSDLYSAHYGVWGPRGPHPGEQICVPPQMLAKWLESGRSDLFYARYGGELIGYAIAAHGEIAGRGKVGWVTQLVVHSDFRNRGVAKRLLSAQWAISSFYGWGIVTASPFAVRALEKVTRRRCRPIRIARDERQLAREGGLLTPYIDGETTIIVQKETSKAFTRFYVDHSGIPAMIRDAEAGNVPWTLGDIDDGWEWFAFTFNDQNQIRLSANEIHEILVTSDQVVREAYARMSVNEEQAWMSGTSYEVDFAVHALGVKPGDRIFDFGCGAGRHSLELARRGYEVTGLDFVPLNIERARLRAEGTSAQFFVADGRQADLGSADGVICLYDVIGSHAEKAENARILSTIASHLKSGARLLLSVMNYQLVASRALHTFEFDRDPDRVLQLAASQTMARTGEVFDPELCLVDTTQHVVYRREQFLEGQGLPIELVVRDRRFLQHEIESMCRATGLDVLWSRHVHLKHWEDDLPATDPSAKEILLLCEKP